jgi:hypothetical protein
LSPEQTTALIVAIGGLVTAVAGLIGAVAALWQKVNANKRAIDGRIDQLLATTRVAGHAEGIALAERLHHPPQECWDVEPGT